jgi:nucleoside-diphosphate-sugar epimerase
MEYFRKFEECPKIVLMAAHIGSNEFNKSGIKLGLKNIRIMTGINSFLYDYSKKKGIPLEVFFYSTSEVYGSLNSVNDVITTSSPTPPVKAGVPRFRYSYGKLSEEKTLSRMYKEKVLSHLVIFRPFNVSGRFQRRGVLFQMVKDAIRTGTISYSGDTTRTITPVGLANLTAVNHIARDSGFEIVNIADPRFSVTMKQLALSVKDYMKTRHHKTCSIVEKEPDKYIRYRHVSQLMDESNRNMLEPVIDDVYREVVSNGR